MNKAEAYKIIYEEAKRSYGISIESIRAYDKKLQQMTILSTTGLGVFFLIAGFFNIDLSPLNAQKIQLVSLLVAGYFFSFIGAILSFIIALLMCLKAYTISELSVMKPRDIKKGYDSHPRGSKFFDELIDEIDYNFKVNSKIAGNLWYYYNESIALIAAGLAYMILFVIFCIVLKAPVWV